VSDPATREEYDRLSHENNRIEGFGNVHVACPFCAAAENCVYELLEVEQALERGATCAQCGRSWKGIVHRDEGGVGFEIAQTGGSDPPAYLPKMRRLS
jgi:hypothetical protein